MFLNDSSTLHIVHVTQLFTALFSIYYLFVDIDDDCESNPCENDGTCTDMGDGYECECENGFTGTNCETGKVLNVYSRVERFIMTPGLSKDIW